MVILLFRHILPNMKNLIIYPADPGQLAEIKSLLERMKIRYDVAVSQELQDWQIKKINEGLSDIESGRVISADEIHKKAMKKKKK